MSAFTSLDMTAPADGPSLLRAAQADIKSRHEIVVASKSALPIPDYVGQEAWVAGSSTAAENGRYVSRDGSSWTLWDSAADITLPYASGVSQLDGLPSIAYVRGGEVHVRVQASGTIAANSDTQLHPTGALPSAWYPPVTQRSIAGFTSSFTGLLLADPNGGVRVSNKDTSARNYAQGALFWKLS